jgi:hypothetical protein
MYGIAHHMASYMTYGTIYRSMYGTLLHAPILYVMYAVLHTVQYGVCAVRHAIYHTMYDTIIVWYHTACLVNSTNSSYPTYKYHVAGSHYYNHYRYPTVIPPHQTYQNTAKNTLPTRNILRSVVKVVSSVTKRVTVA